MVKHPSTQTGKNPANTGSSLLARYLRRGFSCVLLVFLVCLFDSALPQVQQIGYAAQTTTSEYELKAVYLYNFLNFVTWPLRQESHGERETYTIGVVGESPFGDALNSLRKSLSGTGRKNISIIYYGPSAGNDNYSNCHLLFISASEQNNEKKIIAALKDKPVLTVSDHDGFLASGGMINLVQNKGKIRWEINRQSIRRSELSVSAKLLSIAVNVIE